MVQEVFMCQMKSRHLVGLAVNLSYSAKHENGFCALSLALHAQTKKKKKKKKICIGNKQTTSNNYRKEDGVGKIK